MALKQRVIALSILIFGALIYLFAWSSLFAVKSINVTGALPEVSATSLISKSNISIGEKMARIDPRSIEKNLEELGWIKSASVDRDWLHGVVRLVITPRVPVGLFRGQALDASGTLFDFPGKPSPSLPVVSASSTQLGLEAIDLFTSLPESERSALISIGASSESSISSWQMVDGRRVKVMWGANKEIALKVSVYQALLALPENKKIVRVDLSAPHAPIVK